MTKKEIRHKLSELTPREEINITRCKVIRHSYREYDYYLFVHDQHKMIGSIDDVSTFIYKELFDDYIDEVLSD